MYLCIVIGFTRQKKPHLERDVAQWARYKSPRIASSTGSSDSIPLDGARKLRSQRQSPG